MDMCVQFIIVVSYDELITNKVLNQICYYIYNILQKKLQYITTLSAHRTGKLLVIYNATRHISN